MSLCAAGITVGTAGLLEIPALAAMQATCFADGFGAEAETTEPAQGDSALGDSALGDSAWGESALANLLAGPCCFALIALREGEPAGFALARQVADECELLSLGVLPTQRRLGVGRALLAAVCAEAAAKGSRHIYLEVAADNWAGRALYEALGFVPSAWRKNYYRRPGQAAIDAAVLVRHLV